MKKYPEFLILLFLVIFFGGIMCSEALAANADGIRKVHDFIKECGTYYIATLEGDQPRVRPFGTIAVFEGKIYFQTGGKKDVFKQMTQNPNIEICAYDGKGKWIRVQAAAVSDDRREAKQFLLDVYPQLKKMYSADDGNTRVLYLKNATARIYSFDGEPEIIQF